MGDDPATDHRNRRVRRLLQIPKGERVYAREWYKRPAGRKKVVPRYWNG